MRKTRVVAIDAAGRDKGKRFLITEMPASQAERWATRALMAMAKSGMEVPDDLASAGIVGLATLGIRALASMPFLDAEPLLIEMMGCVKYVPEGLGENQARAMIEDDIEEVATRAMLRGEVIDVHTGFSIAAALAEQREAAAKAREQISSDTPTSAPQSAPSSPPA